MCSFKCVRKLTALYVLAIVLNTSVLCISTAAVNNEPNFSGNEEIKTLFSPNGESTSDSATNDPAVTNVTVIVSNKTGNIIKKNATGSRGVLETSILSSTSSPTPKENYVKSQNNQTEVTKAALEGGDLINLVTLGNNTKVSSEHVTSSVESNHQTEGTKPSQFSLADVDNMMDVVSETNHHQTSSRKGVVYNPTSNKSAETNQDNIDCVCCPDSTVKQNCSLCCNKTNTHDNINHSKNESEVVSLKDSLKVTEADNKTVFINNSEIPTQASKETINPTNTSSIEVTYIKGDVYQSAPPLKKKTKPTFTLDEAPTNLPIQLLPFSASSPESNYIIPVVAVILAAPLVIALAMFLYKRGKEFWERRHYRRMDFLIDGMYND